MQFYISKQKVEKERVKTEKKKKKSPDLLSASLALPFCALQKGSGSPFSAESLEAERGRFPSRNTGAVGRRHRSDASPSLGAACTDTPPLALCRDNGNQVSTARAAPAPSLPGQRTGDLGKAEGKAVMALMLP